MAKSTYRYDFEKFFHENMGFKILADEAQYDYVKALLAQNKKVQAVFSNSSAGTGKALTNDSLVQTPNGPIAIGNIKVGDKVFGADGKPCNVLAIHPQGEKEVWKVSFSDGTIIECCEDHLWSFQTASDRDSKKEFKTASIKNIYENIPIKKKSGKWNKNNIYIPMTQPVVYEEKVLKLHPYLLGALLGDGGLSGNYYRFTNSEEDVVEKVESHLNDFGYKLNRTSDYNYNIKNASEKRENISNLRLFLEEVGLAGTKSETKFIPKEYLYASIEQRVELLNGLIDTDGFMDGSGYEYSTASEKMALDIQLLIESLGMTCSMVKKENVTYLIEGQRIKALDSYRLRIKPSETFSKLHTSEKHESKWSKGQTSARRTIQNIEPTKEKKEMTCITVDSADALYLTEHYIVTHNTALAIASAYYQLLQGKINKIIYIRNTVSVRENGFLPGTIEDKEAAYMKPAYDVIQRIGVKMGNQDLFSNLIQNEQLVCTSTSFLRGVDYDIDAMLIIDEAQNLDLVELQTVLTRPHDNVKIVVIGSSLQNDNFKIKTYGPEKLLPFELYIHHFEKQNEIPIENITLTTNYRGKFANYADQIRQSMEEISQKEMHSYEKRLTSEPNMKVALY